jgi:hypothetical protein
VFVVITDESALEIQGEWALGMLGAGDAQRVDRRAGRLITAARTSHFAIMLASKQLLEVGDGAGHEDGPGTGDTGGTDE